jgi:hypothetical protein
MASQPGRPAPCAPPGCRVSWAGHRRRPGAPGAAVSTEKLTPTRM